MYTQFYCQKEKFKIIFKLTIMETSVHHRPPGGKYPTNTDNKVRNILQTRKKQPPK